MTDRERELVASTQDRMLRDADEAFYGDDVPTCGTCGDYDGWEYRSFSGEVYGAGLSSMGICGQLDCICDHDAPRCEWWH